MRGKDGTRLGPSRPRDGRPNLTPGADLAGRYTVLRHLGSGGMGAVYEVHDQDLEEEVALKLLHPRLSADDDYRARLRSEVRLARRVSHPNVCRVHDLGSHDGQLFVTMELIRGITLRSKLQAIAKQSAEPLPLPRRIDIVVQLCSALSAAHRAGVVHRDVKPDNIILEQERVVLTDFGVASPTTGADGRRLLVGTPAYMAPEMLRGEAFDERIDIYAAALVAYEILAGHQAFSTPSLESATQRARRDARIPPLPPHAASAGACQAMFAALASATQPEPAMRTGTVDQFAEQLAKAARSGDLSPPPPAEALPRPRAATASEVTVAAPAGPIASGTTRHTTTSARAQVRIASALYFYCTPKPTPDAASDGDAGGIAVGETQVLELSAAEELIDRIVVDFGGTPLETSATSIIALFGAPVSLGDDAMRAARCAQALVAQTNGGRAGIDTARILLRPGEGRVPRASGDALNRAEGLAHAAVAGQIRISPQTARQLVGRFRIEEITTPSHRDVDRALLLQGELEGADAPRHRRTMLGRQHELEALERLVKDVCERREPQWATVIAPAGLGKSRLRLELMRRVSERREITWLVGRAAPLGGVAPFSLLASAHPDWVAVAERSDVHDKAGVFAQARHWLERRAERRPVVVLLEDAHWADEASLEFFDDLRLTLPSLPVAIISFLRPSSTAGAASTQAGNANAAMVIELGVLGDADSEAIARTLAPAGSDAAIADVVRRAAGNPFFVEELARDLRERGERHATQVTPLPASVEAVIQTRLDRLSAMAAEVTCAASVVGIEFWREAARAALAAPNEVDDREMDEALAELERRAIISARPPSEVDDERYVFHHTLVRDVAYQRLAPRDRRRAHAGVAQWLTRQVPDLAAADPAIVAAIAQHRDSAGDVNGARDAFRTAGERALELYAFGSAARALQRARELTDEPSATLLQLLGDARLAADTVQAGEDAYLEAMTRTDDAIEQAKLWGQLGRCAAGRAAYEQSVEYLERGLAIVTEDGQPNELGRAHPATTAALLTNMGWVLGYMLTDNERGLRYGEAGVALLQAPEHRRDLAVALSRLGGNYMRAGRWADQLRCNEHNLAIALELGDLSEQLTARINLGVNLSLMGKIEEAIAHTERALDLCARTGSATTTCLVQSNLAGLLLDRGEVERARGIVRVAIRGAERIGNRRILPEAYCFAARIRAAGGDLDAAERRARRALAITEETANTIDNGIAARILASILARAGKLDEAETLIQRSYDGLHAHDAYEAARTDVAWARIAAARGDTGRAAALRAAGRRTLESLGAALDLSRMDDPSDIR